MAPAGAVAGRKVPPSGPAAGASTTEALSAVAGDEIEVLVDKERPGRRVVDRTEVDDGSGDHQTTLLVAEGKRTVGERC